MSDTLLSRRDNTKLGYAGSPLNLDHSDEFEWLRLVRDRRWSTRQKLELLAFFETPKDIYTSSKERLNNAITGRLQRADSSIAQAELDADQAWLDLPNHHLITLAHPWYPTLLKEIDDPPIALFAIGNIELLAEPKVAIVGSRRPTPIGAKVARAISTELAQLGIIVTSGMALGIDGLAHQAALDAAEPTIAVMGCGLDTVYPDRHREMFRRIAATGLLLSEYPLGTPPSKFTFPQRNRIVSGLSYGVVIVEAAQRSGTLITARLATEQNREVMVVPGSSVSTQYRGSHNLLRQGAALVLDASHVLQSLLHCLNDEFRTQVEPVDEPDNLTAVDIGENDIGGNERRVLGCIGAESTSVDSIISMSGLTAAQVCSMLLVLEVQGLVTIAEDGGYLNLG